MIPEQIRWGVPILIGNHISYSIKYYAGIQYRPSLEIQTHI